MSKASKFLIISTVVIVLILLFKPFYILEEGEQSVVIRLGKLVKTEQEAGLKLKFPVVDKIYRYSTRILTWDSEGKEVLTGEQQYILVTATARWKIVDPNLFYQTVTQVNRAQGKLDNIIESSIKRVISQHPFVESVRSTNQILENEVVEEVSDELQEQEGPDLQATSEDLVLDEIEFGRQQLTQQIIELSEADLDVFGIELLDIVITQIKYSEQLTQSVYERMIKERNRIAQGYRSYGEGKREEWIGMLTRDRDIILTEAYATAETIKGEADATAAAIYAASYSQDPDFYNFWKAMESYKKTMPELNKTLTTDLDYFKYLYDSDAR